MITGIAERRNKAKQLKPIVNLILELAHNGGAFSAKRYSHYLPKKQIRHRQTTIIIQL